MILIRFLVLLAAVAFLFAGRALPAAAPEIVSVAKIWDRGPHNAFTDLIRFRDSWWCTFREGEGHAGDRGKVRVIVSIDGDKWESAALIAEDGIDLRDPKLSIMPDGRLMLIMGGSVYDDQGNYQTRAPRAAFSADGREWTAPKKLLAEDHWLWRVTWHHGKGYSVSKLGSGRDPRRVMLYRTQDGIHWDWLTELRDIPAWPNEATIRFLDDDEMVVLLRRNKTAWIGTSRPPYTQWKWADTGHQIGGPNFIQLPDGSLWAGGRRYGERATTVLARMTRDSYEPVLTLPSGGDCSYPGLVWHDGLLWMSYYSSHEGQTSIYLAKIRIQPAVADDDQQSSAPLENIKQARVCVTGADHNRPEPFPGLGDFIGWPGGVDRLPGGDLLLVHSAGYWHSSFAQPRQIEPGLRSRWLAEGWPLDFRAPTGGRVMACRSTDGGRTWSRPRTILDHPLDDGAHALFTCRDGTLLCFVGVQASWYGYDQPPEDFRAPASFSLVADPSIYDDTISLRRKAAATQQQTGADGHDREDEIGQSDVAHVGRKGHLHGTPHEQGQVKN